MGKVSSTLIQQRIEQLEYAAICEGAYVDCVALANEYKSLVERIEARLLATNSVMDKITDDLIADIDSHDAVIITMYSKEKKLLESLLKGKSDD